MIFKSAIILGLLYSTQGLAENSGTGTQVAAKQAESGLPTLNTSCVAGALTRNIWISYENQRGENCKVHYEKPQENAPSKVLWSAQQDPQFCQRKAKELIEKQKGWSFECTSKQ